MVGGGVTGSHLQLRCSSPNSSQRQKLCACRLCWFAVFEDAAFAWFKGKRLPETYKRRHFFDRPVRQ